MRAGRHAVMIAVAVFFAFGLAACQKGAVVQPEATQTGAEQKDMGQQPKDQEKVSEKKLDAKVETVESKDKGAEFVESKESRFTDILFDYDQYTVKETYRQELQSVAAWMAKNSSDRLSIEGHCDERGTNEYNLALGDRRAKAVKDYLVSLGVAAGRIDVISYGEERPLCKEQTEDCWAKNRRAHFTILTKAGK